MTDRSDILPPKNDELLLVEKVNNEFQVTRLHAPSRQILMQCTSPQDFNELKKQYKTNTHYPPRSTQKLQKLLKRIYINTCLIYEMDDGNFKAIELNIKNGEHFPERFWISAIEL